MIWKAKQESLVPHPTVEQYKNQPPSPARIEGGFRLSNKCQGKSQTGTPLVSIITIVQDGEATLEKTIDSVLSQTYENIEYIIIDGNSKDETLEIIRKYDDQVAYWMSEPDKGISDAFNKGVAMSNGELIGMVNADDWYSNNAVELVVKHYTHFKDYIIHAKVQLWKKNGEPYYVFSGRDDVSFTMTINHPTVFVPRAVYEQIGLFDLGFKISMDYEWTRRAKQHGKKFKFINKIITNMQLGGISNNLWVHFFEEIYVRRQYGMNLGRNYFIFMSMLVITLVRRLLEFVGLTSIVRIFRRYLSLTKKEIA